MLGPDDTCKSGNTFNRLFNYFNADLKALKLHNWLHNRSFNIFMYALIKSFLPSPLPSSLRIKKHACIGSALKHLRKNFVNS